MPTDDDAKLSVVESFNPVRSGGKFVKTNGRPVGAKAKASRELLKQVKALGPRAVEKLSEAIEANERWAVELAFKYSLPASRTVEFEGMEAEDVTAALEAGDLSPSEAKDIATTIAKLAEVGELPAIKERLEELLRAAAEKR
jgi:hypothetical protein